MIKRIVLLASFPLVLPLLGGCATSVVTVKGYEGATLPPAEVAVVKTGADSEVDAVDGHALAHKCSGWMNLGSVTHKAGCNLTLRPGKHTLSVGYIDVSLHDAAGQETKTTTHSKYLAVVPIAVEGGKTYYLYTYFPPLQVSLGDRPFYGAKPLHILRYVKRLERN